MPSIEMYGYRLDDPEAQNVRRLISQKMQEIGYDRGGSAVCILDSHAQTCDKQPEQFSYLKVYYQGVQDREKVVMAFKELGLDMDVMTIQLNPDGFISAEEMSGGRTMYKLDFVITEQLRDAYKKLERTLLRGRYNSIPVMDDERIAWINGLLDSLGVAGKSDRSLGEIIRLRFGLLNNGQKLTFKALGNHFGVSENTIREQFGRALSKLKKAFFESLTQ